MKKIFALALVLALVFSIGVFAAAESTVSRTISGTSSIFTLASDPNLSPNKTNATDIGYGLGNVKVYAKIEVSLEDVLLDVDTALEQLKNRGDSEHAEELTKFFENAQADENTISYGVVHFGDLFKNAQEETILVPLPAPGVVVGQKVKVTLSNGTVFEEIECKENGVVNVPFPKDAYYIGYVISEIPEITPEA